MTHPRGKRSGFGPRTTPLRRSRTPVGARAQRAKESRRLGARMIRPALLAIAREIIASMNDLPGVWLSYSERDAIAPAIARALQARDELTRESCAKLMDECAQQHEALAVERWDKNMEMAMAHKSIAHTYGEAAIRIRAIESDAP